MKVPDVDLSQMIDKCKKQMTLKYKDANQWFQSQSQQVQYGIVAGATLSSFLLGQHLFRSQFKRLRNVDHVREHHLKKQRKCYGIIPHVGDGDNFRFYHVPSLVPTFGAKLFSLAKYPRTAWFSNKKLKLDEYTLHVRLAGMDAPECAHFGLPGQEYGPVAKQYLTNLLTNRSAIIHMLRKDQYNRLVCSVYIRVWWHWFYLKPLNVSAHMIQQGLGVVYQGQGQVYSEGSSKRNESMRKYLQQCQEIAMRKKKGMWKKKSTSQSPKDYKVENKK